MSGHARRRPVIGILSRLYRRPRFGPQHALFRRMIREADELGAFAYVFTPGGLLTGVRRIRGYRPAKAGGWRTGLYRYPDVVYDRAMRTASVVAALQHLRRKARRRVFNARIGSKWRQLRLLRRDPELRPYIPPTWCLRGPGDLQQPLRRYGAVYVKPVSGGQGIGIWRIERRAHGYRAAYTDGRGRMRAFSTRSAVALYRALRRRASGYIVQPRLKLIRWNDGLADVRVLMQKDGRGVWQMTGAGVRVGRPRGIVSNLSRGGDGVPLGDVLAAAFPHDPERVEEIQREIPRIAERVAVRMERMSRPLGELGIDLAIDEDGRIWFLEANSKTGRTLFRRIEGGVAGREADRRPMAYAMYLAGFPPQHEE